MTDAVVSDTPTEAPAPVHTHSPTAVLTPTPEPVTPAPAPALSVRDFLTPRFARLTIYLEEHGANAETLAALRGAEFDVVCHEMVARAVPHKGSNYAAAAELFMYELGVSDPPTEVIGKVAKYLRCFAETLGVE